MGSIELAPLFFLLSIVSFLQVPRSTAEAPPIVCNSTQDPQFCRTVLPPGNNNLYNYGRFSIARSLTQARKFSRMVKNKLAKSSSFLSTLSVRALQDCDLLSDLNIDFLQSTGRTLNSSDALLDPQAEEAQTLLSALLTNQQTCHEGLQLASSDWSLRAELGAPIANDTKLFSLSLALFSHAWLHGKKRGTLAKRQLFRAGDDGSLPLAMKRRQREIFESAARRRLSLTLPSSNQIFVREVVVVGRGKNRNFTSVNEAINSAPNNTIAQNGYYLIYVTAGVYNEYVDVPSYKQYIMMVGDGINRTVITGNRSVVDGWTTFNSATFAVVGQGFVAVNMTFRNTAGPEKLQAVALRNGADQSTFYRCSFEGYQDTLYTHSLRQFYRQCDVYGTVDFIFGNAAVVFQNCNLFARLPLKNQNNMVTAQGRTDPNQNTGTSLQGCRILGTAELAANGTAMGTRTYLGRPWQLYSRTVVMQSFLDRVIDPAGWAPWNGSFALGTLFYGEYKNTGQGAGTAARVNWPGYRVMTAQDAVNFTVSSFLSGDTWLPATGVPFLGGLT
ncbi:pectinesterase-like [Wolffia australiana]